MAEPKETGFDPEEAFNEGVQYQQQQDDAALREQIAEEMIAAGQDPDEVQQLLFSQGTDVYKVGKRKVGRKGKRRCSAKQWAKMPQICRGTGGARVRTARHPVMVYDPAPREGYKAAAKKYYGGAKKRAKAEKTNLLIGGGAALAAVYAKYTKRATDLKAAGATIDGKPVDGVWKALMYDLKNRPAAPFMDRLEANATEILAPIIGGMVAPYVVGMIPKVPKMVKEVVKKGSFAAVGYGVGNLVGTVLDDIEQPARQVPQQRQQIRIVQPAQIQVAPANSYSSPGGYY